MNTRNTIVAATLVAGLLTNTGTSSAQKKVPVPGVPAGGAAAAGASTQPAIPEPTKPPPTARVQASVVAESGPNTCAVTPNTMPPTRTWCVLDPTKGAQDTTPDPTRTSLTVEWDPIRPGSLRRFLTLSGAYAVTCYSEPKYHPITGQAFHWSFERETPPATGTGTPPATGTGTPPATCTGAGTGTDGSRIAITGVVGGLKADTQAPRYDFGRDDARSTLGGEDALAQLGKVLAEIALDRAKKRGLRVAQKNLQSLMRCEGTPLLPNTCKVLLALRFEDLAASGRAFERAVRSDFVHAALFRISATKARVGSLLEEIASHDTFDANLAVWALIKEAEEAGSFGADGKAKPVCGPTNEKTPTELAACAAVSVIRSCQAQGGCSARRLEELCGWYGVTGEPLRALSDGLAAFDSKSPSSERLRAALRLAVGMSPTLKAHKDLLPLGDAVLQRDGAQILASAVALIGKGPDSVGFRKLASLAGAISIYVDASASGKSSEERTKAQRDAIESLIDSQTSRAERRGSTILSLGTGIGVSGGLAYPRDKTVNTGNTEVPMIQPNVPLALGLDWSWGPSGFGLHADVAPLNAGGYLSVLAHRTVKPSGGDILRPSVTAALSYTDESGWIWLFGPTAGYVLDVDTPTSAANSGPWVGLTVGSYIPIFDFN